MDRAKGVPDGTPFLFAERLSMGHNGVFLMERCYRVPQLMDVVQRGKEHAGID